MAENKDDGPPHLCCYEPPSVDIRSLKEQMTTHVGDDGHDQYYGNDHDHGYEAAQHREYEHR